MSVPFSDAFEKTISKGTAGSFETLSGRENTGGIKLLCNNPSPWFHCSDLRKVQLKNR